MQANVLAPVGIGGMKLGVTPMAQRDPLEVVPYDPVSYTHLRAHETVLDLVCRLLLEKKKKRE